MLDKETFSGSISENLAGDIYGRSNLTKLQLLYWVGQKLRPASPLFNTILKFTFHVEIKPQLFAQAFQVVAESSDALCSIIKEVNGVPQQQTVKRPFRSLDYIDFSQHPTPTQALQDWLETHRTTPLDLETCLFDTALLKLAPDCYVWYLNLHHMITDAGASFLVYEYVLDVYQRLLQGETIVSLPLPRFEEYVAAEQAFRSSPRYPKAKAYWQERLAQEFEPLHFFGRSPVKKSSKVQRISYNLDLERSEKLRAVAGQLSSSALTKQLSASNMFMALFFALLYHLSGNLRLVGMLPFHNRPTKTLRNTIGLMMEFCPLPVEMSQEETFVSLNQKIGREMQRVLLHYQYGSEITLQRTISEVMFNYHQRAILQFQGQPVEQELLHPHHGGDTFALHVHDMVESNTFLLHFDFHEDVFTPEERTQSIEAFIGLIDAFLADREQPVCQLQLGVSSTALEKKNGRFPSPPTTRPIVPPSNTLELQLRHVWEEVLGIKPISIHDNFFDLGGSSWQAMRVFNQIEKLTGQYLPMASLLESGTIAQLAQLLYEQTGVDRWATVVTIQPKGQKRPFFCVHGAGGHVLAFTKLSRFMRPDRPFYAFQAQGLDGKRPLYTSINAMAAHYIQEMRKIQPAGPYLLGGYSMGGAVAFEMAQQLSQQGEHVDLLAIIDTPAQPASLEYVRRFTRLITAVLRQSPQKELHYFLQLRQFFYRTRHQIGLGLGENTRRVLRKLRLLPSVNQSGKQPRSQEMDNEDLQLRNAQDSRIRQMYVINHQAFETYIPQKYNGPVTIFKSTKGYGDVSKDMNDPKMGWGRITDQIETHLIPGTHHAIMIGSNVSLLAEMLQSSLDKTN